MQSRNSKRWLLFVLATSASAAVFADDSPGDADASVKAGVILDADVGVSGNIEGAPIQGMTGADVDARGDVRDWNFFRGRIDPSGNTYGEISGYYVGPFGPPPSD